MVSFDYHLYVHVILGKHTVTLRDNDVHLPIIYLNGHNNDF